MANSYYWTLALSATLLSVLQFGFAQYGIGHPRNITRNAGENNVFIPCPFGGPAAVTWRIGDNYYAQSTLPEPYTSVPGGLIIGKIYQNMSGLSFQCLTPSSNGLYDTESGKGILTVRNGLNSLEESENVNFFGFTPYHSQPINFTRNENDENVFIPCPYGGPAAQTWKIEDHYYSFSTLPENYHPTTGGLIIGVIQNNMSGLTFQCFSPNGTGLYVDESSIGTLTVKGSHNNDLSNELTGNYSTESSTKTQLILDHQNFYFTNTNITLSWKTIGPQCDSRTVYFINATECVIAHEERNANKQYYSMAVMKTNATIPTRYLIDEKKKLMYFSISVGSIPRDNDVCDHFKVFNDITVKEGVLTETRLATPYNDTCINLPSASTSRGALRFVLPYWSKTNSMGQQQIDVICLAECTGEMGCSLVNKCAPALQETIFFDSVTLRKRSNMTNMFQLCFSNPTIEMNGTKVHIYYERSCTDSFSREIIAVAEYVKAIVLKVIVPPPPPNATVNSSSGEICITPPQVNVSFPADYYKISITDNTDYEVFKNESVINECVFVDSFMQLECAPFNVSVVGSNHEYGDSTPTYYMADAGFNRTNWCDCANKKVNLNLKHSDQTDSVEYDYTCSFFKGFDMDLESRTKFIIQLRGNSYSQDSELKTCLNGKGADMFSGLDCDSTYYLSAYFAHPDGNLSDCQVANVQKIEIKKRDSFTNLKCKRARLFWEIMGPLLGLIVVTAAATVVLIVLARLYCKKKKSCCWRESESPDGSNPTSESYRRMNT